MGSIVSSPSAASLLKISNQPKRNLSVEKVVSSKKGGKDPLPVKGRGEQYCKDWMYWTEYDLIDWIREIMDDNDDINILWESRADGRIFEKLIEYAMIINRNLTMQSSVDAPEPPIPGLSDTFYCVVFVEFWDMVMEHLKVLNYTI